MAGHVGKVVRSSPEQHLKRWWSLVRWDAIDVFLNACPTFQCRTHREYHWWERRRDAIRRDAVDGAQVLKQFVPVLTAFRWRVEHSSGQPCLDHYGLGIALAIQQQRLRCKVEAQLLQRLEGGIFPTGAITFIADGELDCKIGVVAGGPVEHVIGAPTDAVNLLLLPGRAFRWHRGQVIQEREQRLFLFQAQAMCQRLQSWLPSCATVGG